MRSRVAPAVTGWACSSWQQCLGQTSSEPKPKTHKASQEVNGQKMIWAERLGWGHVLLCRGSFGSGADAGAHQRTRVIICQRTPSRLQSSSWKLASISKQSSSPAAVTLLPPTVSASDLRELQTSRTVSPGQQVTEHLSTDGVSVVTWLLVFFSGSLVLFG